MRGGGGGGGGGGEEERRGGKDGERGREEKRRVREVALHYHNLLCRVAVCSLMTLAEGSLSSHTRDNISQVMDDISDSTDLLLKGGHYRETSQILTLTGRVSLTLGERHYGLERQEYILQVCVCVWLFCDLGYSELRCLYAVLGVAPESLG